MKEKSKIIESCSFSYSKPDKLRNEDCTLPAFEYDDAIFLAIADGVGGRPGGHIASKLAIDTIQNALLTGKESGIKSIFSKVCKKFHEKIDEEPSLEKMATTLILVKISNGYIEIGNIGDSRAYLANHLKLKQLTKDQTEKQSLIDNKIFKKKDLKNHRSKSILINSMSSKWNYDFEYLNLPYDKGTIILMTDGAYENIKETRVIGNNKNDDLLSACVNIKNRISKNTAKDDYSLVAVSFEQCTVNK